MSDVYLVADRQAGDTRFALKVLKPELERELGERFVDEGQMRLEHPNIVRVHDARRMRTCSFLVLEYVRGESLAERIRNRKGPLEEREALALMKPVLEALNYAHMRGIIHRDVKPSNIIIENTGATPGVPKLCDFGIARKLGALRRTRMGSAQMATPHYMSPEQSQLADGKEPDYRSDLYSAGIVLYEMLTGRVPFGQEDTATDADIKRQHVSDPPPDPRTFNPKLKEGLVRIVLKALRKDPNRRFNGGLEFKRAIEAYEQGAPVRQGGRGRWLIYRNPKSDHTIKIPRGFARRALLTGPIWLFLHSLLWQGVLVSLLFIGFVIAGTDWPMLVLAIVVWALIPASFGNHWLAKGYERRGYELTGRE
jgi:serine/threonine-protein kinase